MECKAICDLWAHLASFSAVTQNAPGRHSIKAHIAFFTSLCVMHVSVSWGSFGPRLLQGGWCGCVASSRPGNWSRRSPASINARIPVPLRVPVVQFPTSTLLLLGSKLWIKSVIIICSLCHLFSPIIPTSPASQKISFSGFTQIWPSNLLLRVTGSTVDLHEAYFAVVEDGPWRSCKGEAWVTCPLEERLFSALNLCHLGSCHCKLHDLILSLNMKRRRNVPQAQIES